MKTLIDAAVATGSDQSLEVTDKSYSNQALLQVSIANTATVTFYGSPDGVTYYEILATNVTDGVAATTATASGLYRIDAAGLDEVLPNVTAWTSGAVTVKGTLVVG